MIMRITWMRSVIIGYAFAALISVVLTVESERAANSLRVESKQEVVEGSGTWHVSNNDLNKHTPVDTEWESSGISPDDEDGDVVEGSGSPGFVPIVESPPVHRPDITSSMPRPPPPSTFDVNIHDNERRPHELDIAIEEILTTTRTLATKRPIVSTTIRSQIPSIFEEDPLLPMDSLLKPGLLAAIIGGVVVGILAIILLVMFIVYRMRKKDEGSYALDEPKQSSHYSYGYQKAPTKEFYA